MRQKWRKMKKKSKNEKMLKKWNKNEKLVNEEKMKKKNEEKNEGKMTKK